MLERQENILQAIQFERDKGRKIVFTNGCFDILHVGHVTYLAEAKSLGDILVVGLNSDDSVRGLKGDTRPIVSQEDRRTVLLALEAVDYVVIFDEETPLKLIQIVSPDILVKGGDWEVKQIVGSDYVFSKGGQVISLPFVDSRSTSSIVDKILAQGK